MAQAPGRTEQAKVQSSQHSKRAPAPVTPGNTDDAAALERRHAWFQERQQAGMSALLALSEARAIEHGRSGEAWDSSGTLPRIAKLAPVDIVRWQRTASTVCEQSAQVPGGLDIERDRHLDLISPTEVIPAALALSYAIPMCGLRRKSARGLVMTVPLLMVVAARLGLFAWTHRAFWALEAIWVVPLFTMIFQWIWSWRDRPFTADEYIMEQLDRLHVTVTIPCYNEDPGLLDRSLFALINQTRPPDRIDVVDDGSKIDYSQLRDYWVGDWACGTQVRWTRQANQGKKHAQAVSFLSSPETDVFVIIDSDTCLDLRAIEEGLIPFANREVASVAGIELAMNAGKNWLTRTVSVRSLFFQMLPCAAQSAVGDVLINRGAFYLVRASVAREFLDAYLNETFLGHPIRLGDDAAMTLFARSRGQTVQQSTAFAMTMYPETLSHHFRQWIRWMRGSTTRSLWRIRYLSPLTFGWWFAVMGIYSLFVSIAVPVYILAALPGSARAGVWIMLSMIIFGYIFGMRGLAVTRSDEGWRFRLGSVLMYPTVLLWGLFVLRPLRVYGTLTFLKQGWVTRTKGAEVSLAAEPSAEAMSA